MSERSVFVEFLEACFWLTLLIGSLYSIYLWDTEQLPLAEIQVTEKQGSWSDLDTSSIVINDSGCYRISGGETTRCRQNITSSSESGTIYAYPDRPH